MIRVAAIKINTLYIKISILCIFVTYLLIIFINSQEIVGNIVKNMNSDFFVLSIQNTLTLNRIEKNENVTKTKKNISINEIYKFILGFDFGQPQTILKKQMSFLAYDEKIDGKIFFSESSIDFNENIEEKVSTPKQEKAFEDIADIKGIRLINETKYNIDIQKYIEKPLTIASKDVKRKVLIYHTHSCESYVPSTKYKYIPSDNDRTEDMNFTVVRVGEELSNYLQKEYNMEVIHDKTVHDRDNYNRAYTKSADTVQKYLEKNNNFDLVIDLHRDALLSNGKKLSTSTTIDDKSCARIMVVVGSDSMGLPHPNWKENLSLGMKLVNKMNNIYPGLSRGINLKTGRFNQYLSSRSILVEVGANGNTLDEALNSMSYTANLISQILE